jgi:Flp pilus assembly pilin Flp
MYLPQEQGQGLVEYTLLITLVGIVVIVVLLMLGPQISNTFSRITNQISAS